MSTLTCVCTVHCEDIKSDRQVYPEFPILDGSIFVVVKGAGTISQGQLPCLSWEGSLCHAEVPGESWSMEATEGSVLRRRLIRGHVQGCRRGRRDPRGGRAAALWGGLAGRAPAGSRAAIGGWRKAGRIANRCCRCPVFISFLYVLLTALVFHLSGPYMDYCPFCQALPTFTLSNGRR